MTRYSAKPIGGRASGPVLLVPALLAFSSCSVGEGEGAVVSERLRLEDCWKGEFDLRPDFFAANPFQEAMMIRLQRGERLEEESDGVLILVNDAARIREERIGESIRLGLSPEVTPPGHPLVAMDLPQVSLSLYLHDTCHLQNSAVYSVDGWIRFDSLFSGNLNEDSAERRLSEGEFEAVMADPRDGVLTTDQDGSPRITYPEAATSVVSGWFRFFFHRGTPAQPFP